MPQEPEVHMDSGLFILAQAQRRPAACNNIFWTFNENISFCSICKFRHACEMCFGAQTAVFDRSVEEGHSARTGLGVGQVLHIGSRRWGTKQRQGWGVS